MSAKDKIKKGLGMTGTAIVGLGVAALYVLKIPPRIVNWVLKNKIKTMAIVAAGWFGYSKIRDQFSSGDDNIPPPIVEHSAEKDRTTPDRSKQSDGSVSMLEAALRKEQAPQEAPATAKKAEPHPMQVATRQISKTSSEPSPQKTEQGVPATALDTKEKTEADKKLDQEAEAAIDKNSFTSTPTADIVNSSGDRVAPIGERLKYFVEMRSKQTREPERSGINTVLICSQNDPNNFVALHLGFHLNPKKARNIREFRLYEGEVKPQTGHIPMVGKFNVNFSDVPGIRFCIDVDQNGARVETFREGLTTLDIRKDNGRTLLLVNEQCEASRILDQATISSFFEQVNLKQGGPVKSRDFLAHTDAGWNKPINQNQSSVPQPMGYGR